MQHNGHKTAIARKTLSTPVRFLLGAQLLMGRILDYGCGRGSDVALLFASNLFVTPFDPHYFPKSHFGQYETIMCNFVLNVIPDEDERAFVLLRIQHLLAEGGTAYISVRNDKRSLKGWTTKGTWQGLIELDLPVVKRTAGYVMYKLTK